MNEVSSESMKPPPKPRYLDLPAMEKTEISFDGSGLTFTQGADLENIIHVPLLYLSSFLRELRFVLDAPEVGNSPASNTTE